MELRDPCNQASDLLVIFTILTILLEAQSNQWNSIKLIRVQTQMSSYPEVTVDVVRPDKLLIFYRLHGGFAVLFNLLGIFLIFKNPKIVPLYRMMMINMQVNTPKLEISPEHLTICFICSTFVFRVTVGSLVELLNS